MNRHVVIDFLRFLLVVFFALIILLQLAFLPWLSGVMADDLPAEAYVRWPTLFFAIAGLACVQVVIVCTIALLGLTRDDDVFGSHALRWVDGIIVGFLAGGGVCLATASHNATTVSGPPFWILLLCMGAIGGVGLALLMLVMRRLLIQASNLRSELDVVI